MHLHRFPEVLRTLVQRDRWARRLPARRLPARRRLAFRRADLSFCLARVSASTATLMQTSFPCILIFSSALLHWSLLGFHK